MGDRNFFIVAALCAASSLGAVAHAQSYSYTQIQQPGGVNTTPRSINNSGVVVGFGATNTSFKFEDGVFSNITIPGVSVVRSRGINNNGVIAGFLRDPGTSSNKAFTLSGTTVSRLGSGTAGASVNATAINDLGYFVGGYTSNSTTFAYKNVAGVFSPISIPGQTTSLATGITNSGLVTGYYQNASGINNGFLEQNGVVTTFSMPGAYWTQPLGINNNGDIVGVYLSAAGAPEQPFVKTGDVYTLLDVPSYGLSGGPLYINATDINDSGVIVGYVGLPSGFTTGYLATPVAGAAAAIALNGGTGSAPVVLPLSKVSSISSAIGDGISEQFYRFNWGGGAFSASLTLSDPNPANSYQFQLCAGVTCADVLSSTKLSVGNWTGTLSSSLAAGAYTIGLRENLPGIDPSFTLSFSTPVSTSVPEPASWAMMLFGFGAVGGVVRSRRQRTASAA